jgi:glycosyltransferase involved in cell wall biosynthesis
MVPPLISVLITAFNREKYVRFAVESALNQTFSKSKYEVVLTKNFDTSLDREWASRGVRLVRYEGKGMGPRVADALKECRGRIIVFLDDDDYWSPLKLERVASMWRGDVVYYHNRIYQVREGDSGTAKAVEVGRTNSWFNSSSAAISREALMGKVEYLRRLPALTDLFYYVVARLTGGALVMDPSRLTYYRARTTRPWNLADLRPESVSVIHQMIRDSGDTGAERWFLADNARRRLLKTVLRGSKGRADDVLKVASYVAFERDLTPEWLVDLGVSAMCVASPRLVRKLFSARNRESVD